MHYHNLQILEIFRDLLSHAGILVQLSSIVMVFLIFFLTFTYLQVIIIHYTLIYLSDS